MARPKKIDFTLVDKLLGIQCTGEEIAGFLNIDYDTLQRRVKDKFKMTFADYSDKKRGIGKVSLRRRQWQKAVDKGDTTMLIFLGKNYLGQSDRVEQQNKSYETDNIDNFLKATKQNKEDIEELYNDD